MSVSNKTDVRKVENGCSEWIISYDRVMKDGYSERKHKDVRNKINSVQKGLGYRVVDERRRGLIISRVKTRKI
jgi:hypothetical protein